MGTSSTHKISTVAKRGCSLVTLAVTTSPILGMMTTELRSRVTASTGGPLDPADGASVLNPAKEAWMYPNLTYVPLPARKSSSSPNRVPGITKPFVGFDCSNVESSTTHVIFLSKGTINSELASVILLIFLLSKLMHSENHIVE